MPVSMTSRLRCYLRSLRGTLFLVPLGLGSLSIIGAPIYVADLAAAEPLDENVVEVDEGDQRSEVSL